MGLVCLLKPRLLAGYPSEFGKVKSPEFLKKDPRAKLRTLGEMQSQKGSYGTER
jgi:hypothetical protein